MERDQGYYAECKTYEYKLKKPVTTGEKEYTVFSIREPLGDDIWKLPTLREPTRGELLDLTAKLANVPSHVMKKLKGVDAMNVTAVVLSFLYTGGSPEDLS